MSPEHERRLARRVVIAPAPRATVAPYDKGAAISDGSGGEPQAAPGGPTSAALRDLSLRGCSLISDLPFARGQRLAIALDWPEANSDESAPVRFVARVVWCTALETSGYQLGAVFEQMGADARATLEAVLKEA